MVHGACQSSKQMDENILQTLPDKSNVDQITQT